MHAPFGPCSDHLRLHALHSHLTFDFSQCRRRIRRLSRSSPPCCTRSATSSTPTRWFRPRRHAPKHAATARRSSTCSARARICARQSRLCGACDHPACRASMHCRHGPFCCAEITRIPPLPCLPVALPVPFCCADAAALAAVELDGARATSRGRPHGGRRSCRRRGAGPADYKSSAELGLADSRVVGCYPS